MFVSAHYGYHFVGIHSCIDFMLLKRYFEITNEEDVLDYWNLTVDECKYHDILVLYNLIKLAVDDSRGNERPVHTIINEYLQVHLNAKDFAKRHHKESTMSIYYTGSEQILRHEDTAVSNPIRDVIAIALTYNAMRQEALMLQETYKKDIYDSALELYGPLSEGIQMKGSIVLLDITKNGISINLDRSETIKEDMFAKYQKCYRKILADDAYSGLFNLKIKDGELVPADEGGKISFNLSRLEAILHDCIDEIAKNYNIVVEIPYVSQNRISRASRLWSEYADYHPFLRTWVDMEQAAYYKNFLSHLRSNRAHPEYISMVRNGRTSATNPPIQQTPRKGGIRELFKASEGHVLMVVDYSFIELCTLAAVCLARYGHSRLSTVIQNGIDPHSFTASMMEGVDFDVFMSWKTSENETLKSKYVELRQRAKAINFGIPSGLSTKGFVQYAKSAYRVEVTDEEAEQFRTNLIHNIYPELSLYLAGGDMERLAHNTGMPEDVCWEVFSFQGTRSLAIEGCLRNIVRGVKYRKKDGKEYNQGLVNRIWRGLERLIVDPELLRKVTDPERKGSELLYKELFGRPVVTLTGRARGKVGYTQACNTPFSGLAADGAKLALWHLYLKGYKAVGFIHDEIILEIPESPTGTYGSQEKEVSAIVCNAMKQLTGPIPIGCSTFVSKVWTKNAFPVYNAQGELVLWEERTAK